MSNHPSQTVDLGPEAGFVPTDQQPSLAHATNDLTDATGARVQEAIHSADAKIRETLHAAKVKSEQIREKAAVSARQLRAVAYEKSSELREQADVHARQIRDTASEQWDETCVKAKELHETAEDYIRQNPTKCVLGALGVGFLIGLMVRR